MSETTLPGRQDATTPWPVIGFAVAAGMVGACQIGKAAIALPALRADLGLGLAAAGWVLSIFNLIGVGFGMALGAGIGRWGDRRTLLLGLALIAVAGLAGAAATGTALLLTTRLVEGVGFLMVIVGAPTMIARLSRPRDLRLAFGVWGTYMPAGQALMLLAAPLILVPFGWRALWIANAVFVAAFAIVMMRLTSELPVQSVRPSISIMRDIRDTAAAPGPLLLAAIFGFYSLQYLGVMGFLPTILIEREGLSPLSASELGAVAIAMNGIGNLGGGMLLQRGAPRWLLIALAAATMGAAGLGIFLVTLPLWASYSLYLVFSGVGGMLPASVLGAAPLHAPAPHLVPATNGLLVQGSNLGQVIGPPALGALAAVSGGWSLSPLVVTTAAIATLLAALALRRRERRQMDLGDRPWIKRI
jgi:cyanate permease